MLMRKWRDFMRAVKRILKGMEQSRIMRSKNQGLGLPGLQLRVVRLGCMMLTNFMAARVWDTWACGESSTRCSGSTILSVKSQNKSSLPRIKPKPDPKLNPKPYTLWPMAPCLGLVKLYRKDSEGFVHLYKLLGTPEGVRAVLILLLIPGFCR